ncbi:unnamed protein product [Phyllotreta striolata]|uniref:C-type lectin domain-containing protein n=1 Tax=Phyllotreta striolata TaxID=444603 RepID=A0A9N9TMX5_PHYSR|nr:unnamed protein product [Phyllotreta striolata]
MVSIKLNSFGLLFLFANVFNEISGQAADLDDWIKQLHFSNESREMYYVNKACEEKNMRLVVLDTVEKNEAIKKYLLQQNNEEQYWIGCRRKDLNGEYSISNAFRWASGGRLNLYQYFAPDRPNNNVKNLLSNLRYYLSIKMKGDQLLWFDTPNSRSWFYICEPKTVKTEPPIPEPENKYGFTFTNYMTKSVRNVLKQCKAENNDEPLFIDSKEKQDAYTKLKKETDDRIAYPLAIQRADKNSPYTYYYNSNITLNFTNWAKGQPSKNAKELCAVIVYYPATNEAKWKSRNCYQYEFAACQRTAITAAATTEAATTEAATTAAATTQAATTEATTEEDEWVKSLYFSRETVFLRQFGQQECEDKKMRMVVLDTEKKNEAVRKYMEKNGIKMQFWIGCQRIHNGEIGVNYEFRWETGSRLNIYKYFAKDRPNNNQGNSLSRARTNINIRRNKDGKLVWFDEESSSKKGYICEPTTVKTEPPIPEPENRYNFTFTNYQTKDMVNVYSSCEKQNKQVLNIDSKEKAEAFKNFKKANDDSLRYPIAISRVDENSEYTYYNTNKKIDYSNWDKGQPSKKSNELCATVQYVPNSDDVKWKSVDCKIFHFIPCENKAEIPKVPTSNPCSGGINGNVNAQAGGVGANGSVGIDCNLAIQGGISGNAGGQAGIGGAGKGGIGAGIGAGGQAGIGGAGKGGINGSAAGTGSAGGKESTGGAGKAGISGGTGGKGSIGGTGKGGISLGAGGQAGIGGAGKGGISGSDGGKGGVDGAGKGGISGSAAGTGSAGGKESTGGAGKGGISGGAGGKGSIGGTGKGGISLGAGGQAGIGGAGKGGIGGGAGGKGSIGGTGKGGTIGTFKASTETQKKKTCSGKNKTKGKGTAGINVVFINIAGYNAPS